MLGWDGADIEVEAGSKRAGLERLGRADPCLAGLVSKWKSDRGRSGVELGSKQAGLGRTGLGSTGLGRLSAIVLLLPLSCHCRWPTTAANANLVKPTSDTKLSSSRCTHLMPNLTSPCRRHRAELSSRMTSASKILLSVKVAAGNQ